MPRFSVLLPVHRAPAMLPYAIETVLAQTVADLELFVICDGAPEATVACANDHAARDQRVTVLTFPKGERRGEAHRHLTLERATGEYVAQIADDDLWFPEHLTELAALLSEADFGHVLHTQVRSDGHVETLPPNLEDPTIREQLLYDNTLNRFGPTFAGYRLDAYRRLPEGWAPAPPSVQTDLHMWRKFLRCPGLRCATRMAITAIHFPSPTREHMSLEARAGENRLWRARLRETVERDRIVQMAWRSMADRAWRIERDYLGLVEIHAGTSIELGRVTELYAGVQAELTRLIEVHAGASAELARMIELHTGTVTELAHLTELHAGVRAELTGMIELHASARAELARTTAFHDRARDELQRVAEAHRQLEHTLGVVLRSKSWRLTAPLRAGLAAIRRLT